MRHHCLALNVFLVPHACPIPWKGLLPVLRYILAEVNFWLFVCFETGSDFVSLIDQKLAAQTMLTSNNDICMLLPSKCWHRSLNFLLRF